MPPQRQESSAFTLIELMVVTGTIVLLAVLAVPAVTGLKGSDEITSAAYKIVGALEQARSYAIANNSYVWVGFYEEDAAAPAPTNATPPYPGKGRLLIALVCSADGTKIFDDGDPIAALPPTRIKQIGKLTRIEGMHLTDIGAPPAANPSPTFPPGSLSGRSALPYTDGSPFDHYNRISSDDPMGQQQNGDQTRFPFSAQNYTFYKTVRFNPRGEANINSTYSLKHVAEIAFRPTHGSQVDLNNPNLVALQFGACGGNFRIYRR